MTSSRKLLLAVLAVIVLHSKAPAPELSAEVSVEDGRPMVIAKVQREGKPTPGVGVAFYIQRTFGEIKLGEDTTLDDGTAAVSLPTDLPESKEGTLSLRLQVTAPDEIAGLQKHFPIRAPKLDSIQFHPMERALWARKAPFALLAALGAILSLIWGAYALVIRELIHLKKGGSHAS